MRFFIIERIRGEAIPRDRQEFAKLAGADLKYKLRLEKSGKLVAGGPFLDTLADGYVLETETLEELGEILFNSPSNLEVDREVHPLGSFADSLEGMDDISKKRK
jgi:hypothetical protein